MLCVDWQSVREADIQRLSGPQRKTQKIDRLPPYRSLEKTAGKTPLGRELINGWGRDRPERRFGGFGHAKAGVFAPGERARGRQIASPGDRVAATLLLPTGRVVSSVAMLRHRALLTPRQRTKSSSSRPQPFMSSRPSTTAYKTSFGHGSRIRLDI